MTRLRPNQQDPNEHQESSHDADSNPSFDAVPNELGSEWNHVADPQTEQDILEAGKNHCHTPRRSLDKASLQLDSSGINQTDMVPEKGRPAKRWEDDLNAYPQPTRTNRDNSDLTSDDLAHFGTKRLQMGHHGKRHCKRLKQPTRLTTPVTTTTTTQPTEHEQTTYTTKVHDKDDVKDDRDILLILSQRIAS